MRPCLVLTRPQSSSDAIAAMALAGGWRGEILVSPLIEIVLDPPPPEFLHQARVLIFTSQHAVAALAQSVSARHWPVWAVGPRTAQAARDHGFAKVIQAGGDAKALLAAMVAQGATGPFLHLRGDHVAADIVAALQARGHEARELVVYKQQARGFASGAKARIAQGGDLVLPIFSPRSAQVLVAELAALTPVRPVRYYLVAISAAAAAAAHALDAAHVETARTPDGQGMLAALFATQAMLEPLEKPS